MLRVDSIPFIQKLIVGCHAKIQCCDCLLQLYSEFHANTMRQIESFKQRISPKTSEASQEHEL